MGEFERHFRENLDFRTININGSYLTYILPDKVNPLILYSISTKRYTRQHRTKPLLDALLEKVGHGIPFETTGILHHESLEEMNRLGILESAFNLKGYDLILPYPGIISGIPIIKVAQQVFKVENLITSAFPEAYENPVYKKDFKQLTKLMFSALSFYRTKFFYAYLTGTT